MVPIASRQPYLHGLVLLHQGFLNPLPRQLATPLHQELVLVAYPQQDLPSLQLAIATPPHHTAMEGTPAMQLPVGRLLFITQSPQLWPGPTTLTIKVRYLVLPLNEMLHQGTILSNHNWHSHREELTLLIMPTYTQDILLCHRCRPSVVKWNRSANMRMIIAVCKVDPTLTLLRKIPLRLPTFPVSLLSLKTPATKCQCTPVAVAAGNHSSSLLMGLLLEEGTTKQVLCPYIFLLLQEGTTNQVLCPHEVCIMEVGKQKKQQLSLQCNSNYHVVVTGIKFDFIDGSL